MSVFTDLLTQLQREEAPIRLAFSTAADGFRTALVPPDQVAPTIARLRGLDADVWWEVQPSTYAGERGRSSAQHVAAVAVLYADLDYKPKPQGIGSLPEALDVVRDLEGALGVPAAAIVHSGHGIQPYWVLEGGAIDDEDARSRMAILLRRWGLMVSMFAGNQQGAVDNVFDLPRILRVPGTVNHKSEPVEVTVDLAERVVTVDLELLEEAFADYEVPVPTSDHLATAATIVSPHGSWAWADEDCTFVQTVRDEIAQSNPASRHHWALKWSAILYGMVRSGCVTAATFAELQQVLVRRFTWLVENEGTKRPVPRGEVPGILRAGLSKAESWDTVKLAEEMRQHLHQDMFADMVAEASAQEPVPDGRSSSPDHPAPVGEQEPGPTAATSQASASAPAPDVNALPGDASPSATIFAQPVVDVQADQVAQFLASATIADGTDLGNAERLTTWVQGRYIHVHGIGWHRWNGHRFEHDVAGQVIEEAKRMTLAMFRAAPNDAAVKWARTSMSGAKLKTMVDLATTVESVLVSPDQLDRDAEVLNTPGGVVELRTGRLRPGNPKTDLVTMTANVAPAAGETPRFDAFLSWAMAGDMEKVGYLQRVFGTALIGDLRWQVLPMFVGSGGNGKSVLFDLAKKLLGMYAHTLPRKFFIEKRTDGHPTDIAALRGKRLAIASEVPPNATFDEDLMKIVTGEQELTGRFMREDFFEFENSATFLLAVNHLPSVKTGGNGFWRRVRKVDFTQQVEADKVNPYLVQELLTMEGPAILQWMIDGAADVLANGMRDPESVMRSTREYRMQEDTLGRFVQQTLRLQENVMTSIGSVFNHYQTWAMGQGLERLTMPAFEREMVQSYPGVTADSGYFYGVGMVSLILDDAE